MENIIDVIRHTKKLAVIEYESKFLLNVHSAILSDVWGAS
jgi:hypothetical protein